MREREIKKRERCKEREREKGRERGKEREEIDEIKTPYLCRAPLHSHTSVNLWLHHDQSML